MKGIYVIATAFLATWALSAVNAVNSDFSKENFYADNIPTKCPLPERHWWNTTTNLPHETDCTLFYKCNVGRPIKQECPLMIVGDPVSRLHYNRLLQVCDWPWQAGCESCPTQYPNGTYPPPSKINNPKNDCQYILCEYGSQSQPLNCPPGTCFSRTCQDCVRDRTNGKCDNSIPKCKEGEERLHDCYCTLHEKCENIDGKNRWVSQEECTGGLHYSLTEKKCVQPNRAHCPYIDHERKKLLQLP